MNQMQDGGEIEGQCKDLGGCTWDAENYYCLKAGASLPCSMSYPDPDNPSCPSNCDYSTITQGCITKGSKPLCEVIYEQTQCEANGCTFYENVYKCWDKNEQVPCKEFEYYQKEDCPSYCEYVADAGSDDVDEGKCMTPGEVLACEEYYDEEECPKERCTFYDDPIYRCIAKDKPLACNAQPEKPCMESKNCQWTKDTEPGSSNDEPDFGMGYCSDCKTADCTETPPDDDGGGGGYNPVDDGKPCSEHKDDGEGSPCPEPRCYMDWGDEDGVPGDTGMCGSEEGGVCRDAKCPDHTYDEDGCKQQAGCVYDSDADVCYDGTNYPCTKIYEQDLCPSSKGCDWVAAPKGAGGYEEGDGFCVTHGAGIPCTSFSGNTDGSACTENGDGAGNNCVWFQSIETCLTKAEGDDLGCGAYNQDPDSCPEPKCSLTDGVCWETGKELPCNAICSAAACENTGRCFFDASGGNFGMGSCTVCEGGQCPAKKPCSSYTDENTCPESHCMFEYDENGMSDDTGGGGYSPMKGTCVDHQCVTMYDSAECETSKLGCTWNAAQFSCWPNAFEKPCESYYDEKPCTAAGCDFDTDTYMCSEKGAKKFCHTIYEESDCAGLAYCQWDDYACYEQQSQFPSTPPPLSGKGDGTGNEDASKCTSDLYDKVKSKLEAADTECVIHDRNRARRGSSKDQQLECLSYFLDQSPNPTTITEACPCLWAWALEIKPWEDHWMKIAC